MVNLRLLPYVASKLFVLMLIVSIQCILLFGTLKLLDATTLMSLPGRFGGIPQLLGADASFTDIFKEGAIYNCLLREGDKRIKYNKNVYME